MRKIFLLFILAGMAIAFGYPWYMYNLTGAEIGTFPAYRQKTGFTPVTVTLSTDQTPVRIFVDMIPLKGWYPDQARTALTLTASTGGRTVLASTLSYVSSSGETNNPQTGEKVFRDRAGDLIVQTPGDYKFIVGEGDIETLSLKQVDLVLRAGAQEADPRAQPAGFVLLAIGVLGFIRSFRRRRAAEPSTVAPPPKEPEKPKWGRDAGG
ncbi:MAG: hypothetical protein WCC66_02635 [Rhizobiaceae bacterium]